MLIKRFALPLVAAALLAAPALAQEKAKKSDKAASGQERLATVNGVAVPAARLEAVVRARSAQGQPDTPEVRAAIRDQIITSEIIAQESAKRGFDKRADVVNQLALARQQVLVQAFVQDYYRTHQPGEADLRREYEMIKTQLGDKEYKARHILVENEDEAKDIIARLKKGEKFEDLAKLSKDPGSKDKGGDLDWATPNSYVKPFAEALVKLDKGQVTEAPVQSPFGWHVIRLDDTRQYNPPSLEEVKPQIVQNLQGQVVRQHVMELRQKAKVE